MGTHHAPHRPDGLGGLVGRGALTAVAALALAGGGAGVAFAGDGPTGGDQDAASHSADHGDDCSCGGHDGQAGGPGVVSTPTDGAASVTTSGTGEDSRIPRASSPGANVAATAPDGAVRPSRTQAPGSRPGNTGEGDARGEVAARLRHSSADGPDSTEAGGACRPTATSTPAAPDNGFG